MKVLSFVFRLSLYLSFLFQNICLSSTIQFNISLAKAVNAKFSKSLIIPFKLHYELFKKQIPFFIISFSRLHLLIKHFSSLTPLFQLVVPLKWKPYFHYHLMYASYSQFECAVVLFSIDHSFISNFKFIFPVYFSLFKVILIIFYSVCFVHLTQLLYY